MVDLMCCLINLLFFDIQLLHFYINLNSPIICCRFSGDIYIYLSFGISILSLASLFFECSSLEDFFWRICNFISNFITNYINSCLFSFLNCFFWSSIYCIFSLFFSTVNKFLTLFIAHVFSKRQIPYPFTNILSLGSIKYLIFIMSVLFDYKS